jgi:ABC-type dipeptide/oligopeptide/nickel transport system ATPase component
VSLNRTLLSASLSADYPRKPGVLQEVSLEIEPGEILGLVGQSGSGKSTLALALMGLLPMKGAAVRGEVIFQGDDLLRKPERDLRTLRGRCMSIVLQSPLTSLNPALSIGTQLQEAWRAHADGSKAEGLAAVRSALESARLQGDKEFLRRRPSQLSVGQAQRVVIAMAILHRPMLLIADEATSALDSITQAEILRLFAGLNREMGMAILYISHDLLAVATLCHRIAILREGRIVECDMAEKIFESPRHEYTRRLVAALPSIPLRSGTAAESSQDAERALVESVHVCP